MVSGSNGASSKSLPSHIVETIGENYYLEVEGYVREVDGDILSVGDVLQQVIGDELQLLENGFPPLVNPVDVTDVFDDLPVWKGAG